jgi:D-serine deaminase-like pyridoxal phosphate-dependent protein
LGARPGRSERVFDALDTPALVVDLEIMEQNIARMAALARAHNTSLWPHAKSHKVPEIANLQLAAGAAGITCQKLGEAEVMSGTGAARILIATPIVGSQKVQRLLELATRTGVTTVVDSLAGALPLSEAATRAGIVLDAFVEVDIGYRRCGVDPLAAVILARAITEELPGLAIVGVFGYEGHLYDAERKGAAVATVAAASYAVLGDAAARVRREGLAIDRVSVGATAGAFTAMRDPAITEYRPGSYLFNDGWQIAVGSATEEQCAAWVVATVVSARDGHAVLDAGSKALSFAMIDGIPGYGSVVGHRGAVIERLSDEHSMVSHQGDLAVGDRVAILPNAHSSVVDNFDEIVGFRGDDVEVVWKIAARGRMQ